jgi:hypothetical protein
VERLEDGRLFPVVVDFAAAQVFPSGAQTPRTVAVEDFNGDGKHDLAVGHFNGTVSVMLGKGTGGFTPGGSFGSGGTNAFFVATGGARRHSDCGQWRGWQESDLHRRDAHDRVSATRREPGGVFANGTH